MIRKILITTLAAAALLTKSALAGETASAQDPAARLPACCEKMLAQLRADEQARAVAQAAAHHDGKARADSRADEDLMGQVPYWNLP